ncbi:MAG: dickkopf-related protein [Candidatus Staskawiczbacteria bacterium]|nr:dickkopf-related protein [Candidatus Staskawiczbacteria bacterium]
MKTNNKVFVLVAMVVAGAGISVFAGNFFLAALSNTSVTVTPCSTDSDCGTSEFTGSLFCQGNDVYQNYIAYTCNNPGTLESSCTTSTTAQLQTTCSSGQACSNGNCTGGGGGGYDPGPFAPAGDFKVTINNGDQYTKDRNVQLSFIASSEITTIIISNKADFTAKVLEIPFQDYYVYDLCSEADSCPEGKYTVYVKFSNKYRAYSDIIQSSITIGKKPTIIEQAKEVSGKITSQIIQGLIDRVNDIAMQAKELASKMGKQTTNVLTPKKEQALPSPALDPATRKTLKTMGYVGEPINWRQAIFGTGITTAIIIILILLLAVLVAMIVLLRKNKT